MSMEIRWQLIRGFERSLLTDNENIALRRQMELLKAQKEGALTDGRIVMKKIYFEINQSSTDLRKELNNVRLQCQEDLNKAEEVVQRMKIALLSILDKCNNESKAKSRLENDNNRLLSE